MSDDEAVAANYPPLAPSGVGLLRHATLLDHLRDGVASFHGGRSNYLRGLSPPAEIELHAFERAIVHPSCRFGGLQVRRSERPPP